METEKTFFEKRNEEIEKAEKAHSEEREIMDFLKANPMFAKAVQYIISYRRDMLSGKEIEFK